MLNPGTWAHFHVLRDFLTARYSEEIVAAALGVPRIADFDKRDPRMPIRDTLVKFFFGGAAVPVNELRRAIPSAACDAMAALGLVTQSGDQVWCPFILYPTHQLQLLSDRFMRPDGRQAAPEREFVYFALTANTQTYLDMLPERPCASFLDMGAGCGAAALLQARYAQTSCASDISVRSTQFAEFNSRLNEISNVEAVQGSLYEPLEGRLFERIGCHPPYDLSTSSPWTFSDGGDDGEFVIRGTINGLPDHLAPGGEFFGLFRGADREGKPLEQRIREWLGERNDEFDIALVVRGEVAIQDYAIASILSTSRDLNLYDSYISRFNELGVERLVYSSVLIRRKASRSSPLTLRREMGSRCTSVELGWLLDWETAAPKLDIQGAVMRTAPDMQLVAKHEPAHGELRPTEYILRGRTPFASEMACPEWVAVLVSKCVKPRPVEEVYRELHEQAPMNSDQFTSAVKRLVSAGVIQLASGNKITNSN